MKLLPIIVFTSILLTIDTQAIWTLSSYPWHVKPVWLNTLADLPVNRSINSTIKPEFLKSDIEPKKVSRQDSKDIKKRDDYHGLVELVLIPYNTSSLLPVPLIQNSVHLNNSDKSVLVDQRDNHQSNTMANLETINQNLSPTAVIKTRDISAEKGGCSNSDLKNSIDGPISRSVRIGKRFKNPWSTWNENAFRVTSLLKFGISKDHSSIPNQKELDNVLPIEKPDFSIPKAIEGVKITWIGHSTVVAQIDGFTVITDPVFSQRASPSQYFGPKRYRDPACNIAELPENLNAVVISHNHYDHLDVDSVKALNNRYGSNLTWFVPIGLREWLDSMGIKQSIEMDWWDEKCMVGNIKIAFTPAQHWSKRGISDDFTTLWGSWTIIGPKNRFFFTGDTGYCPVFKEIGDIYGPFTVAAIPIGAYEPRWFMKPQHVDPEEAAMIHQDLKSHFSFAIHWGTFALANEYFLDPPIKLKAALEKFKIPTHHFITMKHGESKIFPLG